MEQGEIIGGLFAPADQDGAEAVEPGMGALDDPAARFGLGLTLGLPLFAPGAQVQGKGKLLGQFAWLAIVIAFIQTQVLWAVPGRARSGQRERLQGLAHQLMVVAIGAVDHHAQWHAVPVGQQ